MTAVDVVLLRVTQEMLLGLAEAFEDPRAYQYHGDFRYVFRLDDEGHLVREYERRPEEGWPPDPILRPLLNQCWWCLRRVEPYREAEKRFCTTCETFARENW